MTSATTPCITLIPPKTAEDGSGSFKSTTTSTTLEVKRQDSELVHLSGISYSRLASPEARKITDPIELFFITLGLLHCQMPAGVIPVGFEYLIVELYRLNVW